MGATDSAIPMALDPAVALAEGMRRVNGYKGSRKVSAAGAQVARDFTRDSLPAGTQPLSKEWVVSTLAIVGLCATWAENNGIALTPKSLLNDRTWQRWMRDLKSANGHNDHTIQTFRYRLELIAHVLVGRPLTSDDGTQRAPMPRQRPMEVLTDQQQADLWAWCRGMRPATRRERVQRLVVLGLGVGAHRRDMECLTPEDFSRDGDGVRVSFAPLTTARTLEFPGRTVTCLPQWEGRLWELVQATEQGRSFMTPWSEEHSTLVAHDAALRNSLQAHPLGVDFTVDMLRNTWLVQHMAAGTRLDVLMQQAALRTTTSIEKLRIYLPPPSEAETRAWMRAPGPSGRPDRAARPGEPAAQPGGGD